MDLKREDGNEALTCKKRSAKGKLEMSVSYMPSIFISIFCTVSLPSSRLLRILKTKWQGIYDERQGLSKTWRATEGYESQPLATEKEGINWGKRKAKHSLVFSQIKSEDFQHTFVSYQRNSGWSSSLMQRKLEEKPQWNLCEVCLVCVPFPLLYL